MVRPRRFELLLRLHLRLTRYKLVVLPLNYGRVKDIYTKLWRIIKVFFYDAPYIMLPKFIYYLRVGIGIGTMLRNAITPQ